MQHIKNFLLIIALMNISPAIAAVDLNASLSLDEAKHILNRTGFGASAYELNQLTGQSKSAAINTIVNGLSTSLSSPPPKWVDQPAPHHWARNQLTKTARREFNETRYREIENLRLWWTNEMIQTPSPQTERLVLFWHNHFATAYSAINDQAISLARQHMLFRAHGSGNFRTLLKAIIRDPAMLNYLDNDNSRKTAPNENLARELMELFTLGEGNYTENDIKNAARALTGYSTAPTGNLLFHFKANEHDGTKKTLFGHKDKFDGDGLVDQILKQPAAAEFIARKFWKMLISDQQPEQQQIKPLANRFRNANYDIKTLYKAVLESDAFWSAENRASIVRSPVSLTIGTIRSTGIVPASWQTLPAVMNQLGQQPFDPPNVAGWPGGRSWITPSRLLNRLEWLRSFNKACEGADCTSSSMASMSSINSSSMQMAGNMSANDSTMNSSADLVIRMASEEFDGPAVYKVTLTRGDMILWSSGERPLIGGHDTKIYGQSKGGKSLPWRNVSFTLSKIAQKFDAIEIEYLNDKNQAGAQRNLFVDWAMFNQKFYSAKLGEQTNNCPNKKNSRHGSLLCNGKVRLSKSSSSTPDAAAAESNRFSVGRVLLQSVTNPEKRNGKNASSSISFVLTDVQLDDRKWHSLTAQYVHTAKNNQYKLKLNPYGCWPNCLEQWPACGKKIKDQSQKRSLVVTMSPKQRKSCSYDSLTTADKKLINSLWINLPQFYEQTKNNKKLNRPKVHNAHSAWSGHIEKINSDLERHLQSDTITAEAGVQFVQNRNTFIETGMHRYHPNKPLAAGRTATQQNLDMQTLVTNNPGTNLASLLLPGNTGQIHTRNVDLQDVLVDLAFQLK